MTAPERVSGITDVQVRLPRFDWRGTGLRKSVNAARWTLLFVLVNLVASTVVTRLAS